mmetsp:Transcript_88775/g.240690  ORF Transcript_88775/g.240690 Transcript_88775/m.240690 type:complete len:270 (+) Transcript_88775:116-925(+)
MAFEAGLEGQSHWKGGAGLVVSRRERVWGARASGRPAGPPARRLTASSSSRCSACPAAPGRSSTTGWYCTCASRPHFPCRPPRSVQGNLEKSVRTSCAFDFEVPADSAPRWGPAVCQTGPRARPGHRPLLQQRTWNLAVPIPRHSRRRRGLWTGNSSAGFQADVLELAWWSIASWSNLQSKSRKREIRMDCTAPCKPAQSARSRCPGIVPRTRWNIYGPAHPPFLQDTWMGRGVGNRRRSHCSCGRRCPPYAHTRRCNQGKDFARASAA